MSLGQRVSREFDHEGHPTVFIGTIVAIQPEPKTCDVDFDDGTKSRHALSKLITSRSEISINR